MLLAKIVSQACLGLCHFAPEAKAAELKEWLARRSRWKLWSWVLQLSGQVRSEKADGRRALARSQNLRYCINEGKTSLARMPWPPAWCLLSSWSRGTNLWNQLCTLISSVVPALPCIVEVEENPPWKLIFEKGDSPDYKAPQTLLQSRGNMAWDVFWLFWNDTTLLSPCSAVCTACLPKRARLNEIRLLKNCRKEDFVSLPFP